MNSPGSTTSAAVAKLMVRTRAGTTSESNTPIAGVSTAPFRFMRTKNTRNNGVLGARQTPAMKMPPVTPCTASMGKTRSGLGLVRYRRMIGVATRSPKIAPASPRAETRPRWPASRPKTSFMYRGNKMPSAR